MNIKYKGMGEGGNNNIKQALSFTLAVGLHKSSLDGIQKREALWFVIKSPLPKSCP